MSPAAGLSCPAHPNAALMAAEDTGIPACRVCVATRVADLADHAVWIPKYRKAVLLEAVAERLSAPPVITAGQIQSVIPPSRPARKPKSTAPPLRPGEEVLP